MQWYPGDWQRDFGVRSCSLAARGLWREMLDVMHDGEPRGTMQVGRKIITDPAEIAALVAAKPGEDVAALLAELEAADVFSRNEAGAIYSRRMVRDTYISDIRRVSGSEGGKVAQAKVRGKNEEPPADADAVEEEVEKKEKNDDFDALWSAWARKVGKGAARKAFKATQKTRPPLADLLATVAKLQASYEWTREGRKYQPHLATWLNREGWCDELTGEAAPERGAVSLATLRAGSRAEVVSGPSTQARLAALAASLPDALVGVAGWRLGILRLSGDPEAVEAKLAEMDGRLMYSLHMTTDASLLSELDAKARAARERLSKRIAGPELDAASSRLLTQLLRGHAGIPVLSLFSDEAKAA